MKCPRNSPCSLPESQMCRFKLLAIPPPPAVSSLVQRPSGGDESLSTGLPSIANSRPDMAAPPYFQRPTWSRIQHQQKNIPIVRSFSASRPLRCPLEDEWSERVRGVHGEWVGVRHLQRLRLSPWLRWRYLRRCRRELPPSARRGIHDMSYDMSLQG